MNTGELEVLINLKGEHEFECVCVCARALVHVRMCVHLCICAWVCGKLCPAKPHSVSYYKVGLRSLMACLAMIKMFSIYSFAQFHLDDHMLCSWLGTCWIHCPEPAGYIVKCPPSTLYNTCWIHC